ncbi:glycosyltransferase family 2 protein [Anoxybacter fermentans]|nr:glycosyltransferase family 2 protein [Anoxybacter fermentans]
MISVLIPAFNEAERIAITIQSLRKGLVNENFEVIVIDDGSTDKTGDIARNCGATVVSLPTNRGKGTAINQGLKKAGGDIFLLVDADLGESAQLIAQLLKPIQRGEADLTIARFPVPQRKGGFGLVKGLAHHGLYLCTGTRFYSPISGQRAMRRQVLDVIGPFRTGWGMEVAMTIDAYHKGFRIMEVPLDLTHRQTGRNLADFIHRGQQFRDIFFTLIQAYWQYRLKKGGSKK